MPLGQRHAAGQDRKATLDFQRKVARLQRAVAGAVSALDEGLTRIELIQKALLDTPAADPQMLDEARTLEERIKDLNEQLTGDPVKGARNEPTPPSIGDRVFQVVFGSWTSTSSPTQTAPDQLHPGGRGLRSDARRTSARRSARTWSTSKTGSKPPALPGRRAASRLGSRSRLSAPPT